MNAPTSARAPGKLVLSGAYAVLLGAPAVVAAVDRYATARLDRPADFESEEVLAAFADLRAEFGPQNVPALPWVDASELRTGEGAASRKLGLGSSAAILVASLALVLARLRGAPAPVEEVRRRALLAHRKAQGGGSGVDVDAASHGGVRVFQRRETAGEAPTRERPVGSEVDSFEPKSERGREPHSYPTSLPSGLVLEAWAAPRPAKTQDFIRQVFALRDHDEKTFDHLLAAQCIAALEAERALNQGDPEAFAEALAGQSLVLEELGRQANVPIFLPELAPLRDQLPPVAAWLPAGAGGGDIMLYVGQEPSPQTFRRATAAQGLERLALKLGAPGAEVS